jgi:hypothetical protein
MPSSVDSAAVPGNRLVPTDNSVRGVSAQPRVAGARLVDIKLIGDERGLLSFGEVGNPLPFTPTRYFTISNVPSDTARGGHAHLECHQFLACIAGSCSVELDDGIRCDQLILASPGQGLHVAPMTWVTLQDFANGTVLLVLASHNFDEGDYVRRYDDFIAAVSSR